MYGRKLIEKKMVCVVYVSWLVSEDKTVQGSDFYIVGTATENARVVSNIEDRFTNKSV